MRTQREIEQENTAFNEKIKGAFRNPQTTPTPHRRLDK